MDSHFDSDVEQARRARRAFCERYADTGRIVRHGETWRFRVTHRGDT